MDVGQGSSFKIVLAESLPIALKKCCFSTAGGIEHSREFSAEILAVVDTGRKGQPHFGKADSGCAGERFYCVQASQQVGISMPRS